MATMKAVRIHAYGGPEVLKYEDAPRPEPKGNEVLVRVLATSVNPIDWKIRSGHMSKMQPVTMPFILGWDVSGTVEAVGDDVKDFMGGEEVFAYLDTHKTGAYAEYVIAEADTWVRKPESLDHVYAAAIPLAGLTAYHGLFEEGNLEAGQRVLIHGGAGGMGGYAIQLAKWKGAYVIATASGNNQDFLRELGADEPIDYTAVAFETVAKDIDLVFDTIGGDTQIKSYDVLKKSGRLVSTVGVVDADKAKEAGIEAKAFRNHINPEALKLLGDMVVEGKLKVTVQEVLPLSDARKAHEISEGGHVRGKIVMEP